MRQNPDFKKSSGGRGKRSTDEIRSPTPNIKFTTQVDSGVRAFSLVPVLPGLCVNRRQFVSIERIASVKPPHKQTKTIITRIAHQCQYCKELDNHRRKQVKRTTATPSTR